MRTLISAMKIALDNYQAERSLQKERVVEDLLTLFIDQMDYLSVQGFYLDDPFYSLFNFPHTLSTEFGHGNYQDLFAPFKMKCSAYQQVKKQASERLAPLQNFRDVISKCLDENNVVRFQKLLEMILRVEKIYQQQNISAFSLFDLAKHIVNSNVLTTFLSELIRMADPFLLAESKLYKEELLDLAFTKCEESKITVSGLGNIFALLECGASLQTKPEHATYLERVRLFPQDQIDLSDVNIARGLQGITEKFIEAAKKNPWHDEGYAAISYGILMMRYEQTEANIQRGKEIVAHFLEKRLKTPASKTEARFTFKKIKIDDDGYGLIPDQDLTAYFLLHAMIMATHASQSFAVQQVPKSNNNNDDDNVGVEYVQFLDKVLVNLYKIYRKHIEIGGVNFPEDTFKILIQAVAEREDGKFLHEFLGSGPIFNEYLPMAVENLVLEDVAKSKRIVKKFIQEHVFFEGSRPLSDFTDLFATLDQSNILDRAIYFYETLICARGFDKTLATDFWPTRFIKEIERSKEHKEDVAHLINWAQINFDYFKNHLEKTHLVDTFLIYLDSQNIAYMSDVVRARIDGLLKKIGDLPKDFNISGQQQQRFLVAELLNSILNELTRYSFSSLESKGRIAKAYNQLLEVEAMSSFQVMPLFFNELIDRMLAKEAPLVLHPYVWQGLREGYIKAWNQLSDVQKEKCVATKEYLEPMEHPTAETAQPIPNPSPVAATSSSSSVGFIAPGSMLSAMYVTPMSAAYVGKFFQQEATPPTEVELSDMPSDKSEQRDASALDDWYANSASPSLRSSRAIQLLDDEDDENLSNKGKMLAIK